MTISTRLCLHARTRPSSWMRQPVQLPAVLHWAPLSASCRSRHRRAGRLPDPPIIPNGPDAPVRVALVPEGAPAGRGVQGLSGSRDGRDWTPHWVLSGVTIDGAPAPEHANLGPCLVVFEASDARHLPLGLTIEVELLASGLVRARAAVQNTGDEDYRVDELLVAFPVPMRAREILDFAGRWTRSASPSGRPCEVGTHWREARHGRTGADSAFVLHLGAPGFGFADGELWAVHTAWSGNHVHYAERLASGDQVVGGESCCCQPRARSRPGRPIEGRGSARAWRRTRRRRAAVPPDRSARVRNTRTCGVRSPSTSEEAVYFDHDLDRLVALAERAASIGVRAVRPRRRLVRRTPRRSPRPRRLVRLPGRVAPWPAPPHRQGDPRSACSSGFGSSPRWSTSTATWPAPIPSGSCSRPDASPSVPLPAGPQHRPPGRLRLRPRPHARLAGRIPDRLHQVGPQPRPGRRRIPRRRACPACIARPRLTTGCWTSSRPPTPAWRSRSCSTR